MPKIVCYALTWSPVHHVYELHERQGHEALDIVPESQARLIWSSQISSFAFHGKHGSFTVRKERKQRGGEYWCAYARVGGKLTKRYVGRDCDLTPARLEQVAQELWRTPQAVLWQKEAPGRPRGIAPTIDELTPTRRNIVGAIPRGRPDNYPHLLGGACWLAKRMPSACQCRRIHPFHKVCHPGCPSLFRPRKPPM